MEDSGKFSLQKGIFVDFISKPVVVITGLSCLCAVLCLLIVGGDLLKF